MAWYVDIRKFDGVKYRELFHEIQFITPYVRIFFMLQNQFYVINIEIKSTGLLAKIEL